MDSGVLINLKRLVLNGSDEEALLGAIDALLLEVCEAMLSLLDDQIMRRYVGFLQIECTKMMDLLTDKIISALGDTAQFIMVNCHLGVLLLHLRNFYPQFYDDESAMPRFIKEQRKRVLVSNVEVMYAQLKAKIRDKDLLRIIEGYCLGAAEIKVFSFRHLELVERLIDHLTFFCRNTASDDFDRQLMDVLVTLDFRNPDFIGHYFMQIKSDLGNETEGEGQIRVLQDYQHRLSKSNPNTFDGIHEKNATFHVITDYLLSLLNIGKVYMDSTNQQGRRSNRAIRTKSVTTRLKTSFSVDVLAYLAKLHVDCGFLPNTVKAELFSFLATRIETVKVGDSQISAGSIKNKYNQIVESTAIKTRVMLMKMVKQIDRDFKR